jgi:hypothetical protein
LNAFFSTRISSDLSSLKSESSTSIDKCDISKVSVPSGVVVADVFWIPQGAAYKEAEEGVNELVDEIIHFVISETKKSDEYQVKKQSKTWKVS